jgi:triosephosphate isomerase
MKKLIVGNLKMNILTLVERDKYFESFEKELKKKKLVNSQIVLCPPAVHVESFVKNLKTKSVSVGAQNIFWEERGSYTGEISAPMVKNLGAEYVILGHSERRKYFSETNEIVNAKIKIAIKNGLKPIYCVGETQEERLAGNTTDIIRQQINTGLAGVPASKMHLITIAYEPIWAVGTDKIPESNEILEVKILLKKMFTDTYGPDIAGKIAILYGGSVKAAFAQKVCVEPGLDGVLVGRESLVPNEFIKIAEIIDK